MAGAYGLDALAGEALRSLSRSRRLVAGKTLGFREKQLTDQGGILLTYR